MNFWLNLSKPKKIIAVAIFVLLLGIGLYLLFPNIFMASPQLKDFSKQPRPAPILPTGQQTYEIIQQDFTYQPKIRFVSLDPVDPKAGEEQKIIVQVDAYSKPVSVVASVISDNEPKELRLSEVQNSTLNLKQRYFVGDDNNLVSYADQKVYREDIANKLNARISPSNTITTSSAKYVIDEKWPVASTTLVLNTGEAKQIDPKTELRSYEYAVTWTATKDFSDNPAIGIAVVEEFSETITQSNPALKLDPKVGLTPEIIAFSKKNNIPTTISTETKQTLFAGASFGWRSACQTPLADNWELGEDCVVGYPDGVEGGNLLVKSAGILLAEADIAINPGKSIIISNDGKIIINKSKEIKESYIWKKVSDGAGTEEVLDIKSPGREYLRRYLFDDGKPEEFTGLNANGQIFKIKTGKNQFTVSGGRDDAPKIIQGEIDPLDVRPGDTQTMKIVVQSDKEIASVIAQIETDKGIVEVPMKFEGKTAQKDILPNPYFVNEKKELVILPVKKASDDIAESSFIKVSEAIGAERLTYSGSWVVKDTVAKKYRTKISVKDVDGGENSITMAWSDPCGTNLSYTDSLYVSNCTTAVSQGNSRGNLAIGRVSPAANPTITINNGGILFAEEGYAISLVGTSSIVVNTGGQIRIAYTSARDEDSDNYAIGSVTFNATPPASPFRSLKTVSLSWTDCRDTDPLVNPGAGPQEYSGSNGWDWNCNGIINSYGAFTAGCGGIDGICSYYGSCAYGGFTAGYVNASCGCTYDYADGCTGPFAGPGGGGCVSPNVGYCDSSTYNITGSGCMPCN